MAELKTWVRRPDIYDWPLDFAAMLGFFSKTYTGKTWLVEHGLGTSDIIVQVLSEESSVSTLYTRILSDNIIEIEFDRAIPGKCIVMAVKPTIGVSVVHVQDTPDTIWTIDHNFGDDTVLCEFWANDERLAAEYIEVTSSQVKAYFSAPISGKACIVFATDWVRQLKISWSQIIGGVPTEWTPGPHTHAGSDLISPAPDSERLGGILAERFLYDSLLGVSVPPLVSGKIPVEYIPIGARMFISDGAVEEAKSRLIFNGTGNGMFQVSFPSGDSSAALIKVKPVLGTLALQGNVASGLSSTTPSSSNTLSLVLGDGLRGSIESAGVVRIDNTSETTLLGVESGDGLEQGGIWEVRSTLVGNPNRTPVQIFENKGREIGALGTLDFISSENADNLDAAFVRSSSLTGVPAFTMLEKKIQNVSSGTDHHIMFSDTLLNNLGFIPTAIYYSSYFGGYLLRYDDSGNSVTRFYTVSMAGTVTPLVYDPTDPGGSPAKPTIPITTLPKLIAFHDNKVWRLVTDTGLGRTLLQSSPTLLSPVWTTVEDYSLAMYDSVDTVGFTVNNTGVYVIWNSTRKFAGWNRVTRNRDVDLTLSVRPKGLVLHVDGTHIVSTYTNKVYKSNNTDLLVSLFTAGCESELLYMNHFAINNVKAPTVANYHIMSIRNSTEIWLSEILDPISPVYQTGKVAVWSREISKIRIPMLAESVQSLSFKSPVVQGRANVRVLFRKGPLGDIIPDTLWRWNFVSGAWEEVSTYDIPTSGNTLSEVASISGFGVGGDDWYYFLYVDIPDPLSYVQLLQQFELNYTKASRSVPIFMHGDADVVAGTGVQVELVSGAVIVTNCLGRKSGILTLLFG